MTNKLDPDSLEQIIDKVAAKRKKITYNGGTTRSDNIRTWVIADVLEEVTRHIGNDHGETHEYTSALAELVDMVERHWSGGIRLTEHLLNAAINDVLEDSRRKGKINDASRTSTAKGAMF